MDQFQAATDDPAMDQPQAGVSAIDQSQTATNVPAKDQSQAATSEYQKERLINIINTENILYCCMIGSKFECSKCPKASLLV